MRGVAARHIDGRATARYPSAMSETQVRTRRWSRVEYERLIDRGMFRPDERLELIGGLLVVREPPGEPHAVGIEPAGDALRAAFGAGWRIRCQLPVALDDESEPEPDFSVVRGSPREASEAVPARPELIVEVADSSLAFEVYREPVADPEAPYGWRYGSGRTLTAADVVSPLAAPRARIAVADLLP